MSVLGTLDAALTYILSHFDTFLTLLREHLALVLVSVVLAIVVAIPLGVLATRNKQVKRVVMSVGNVAQTVPTLAIIALVFPLLGLGFLPSLVGLFTYALLPILTNTVAGLEDVDESTVAAARGMGMTENQILRKIKLPLALPVIFAGIRTSAVLNVGTAYLAFFIGGGGLGVWVITGISLFDTPQLLAGAIPGALLAIGLDLLFALIERRLGTNSAQTQTIATG
ncbi:binding-protein-dependent transport systems inner membrane component [Haladaptatus paucihalophilus DX253]|uniref:Binding-protein-dependent transport systems inner membrane component n=2 Tax=Haladaptatus TaxID=367188 RepID=E7QZL4_HALPU|nr:MULTISPECIES: ABC transporter permease [Haladaptatus]EFW90135.1 binding-protein-dependent transport systems inner membrane component [Haladaptatus paucihalophilus DX253]GKZ14566.1 glycine betaine/carnitine/choline ABC transporter permease [Haladaptatus sp. T7]SHL06611.1 osmoprotectant transport system permease protein [Haladaptatus paucihalophilus DX253]